MTTSLACSGDPDGVYCRDSTCTSLAPAMTEPSGYGSVKSVIISLASHGSRHTWRAVTLRRGGDQRDYRRAAGERRADELYRARPAHGPIGVRGPAAGAQAGAARRDQG